MFQKKIGWKLTKKHREKPKKGSMTMQNDVPSLAEMLRRAMNGVEQPVVRGVNLSEPEFDDDDPTKVEDLTDWDNAMQLNRNIEEVIQKIRKKGKKLEFYDDEQKETAGEEIVQKPAE